VSDWLRTVVQAGLRGMDSAYQRLHDLVGVGPLLYVGRAPHQDRAIEFPDGTMLETGQAVGTLHFNNDRFTRIDGRNARRAALEFTRLMLQSLHELAHLSRQDPDFQHLAAYHGISWLPAHGARVGFLSSPYPDGLKKRWMNWHFKLLIWAFAPARESRLAQPDPHHFWLTRIELLQRFPGTRDEIDRSTFLQADPRPA
jgi:hypothetical protein